MKKTIHVDDIDGTTDDVQTVQFSIGKDSWEIDLSEKNRDRLTATLDPFISHARRSRKTTRNTTNGTPNERRKIREWAKKNGHDIARSGKIPDAIIAAYKAATV